MAGNNRVLMIAYLFPPIANSGVQRPLKFAKHLKRLGWDLQILTVDRALDECVEPELMSEVPKEAEIIRIPMLCDKIGERLGSFAFTQTAGRKLAEAVSWRLREKFIFPDRHALWRPTAKRAALKLFHRAGYDVIWATGFPWTSLLVGRDVSRITGKPLVVDFRDPWSGEDELALHDSRHQTLERSVLDQASAVVSAWPKLTESLIRNCSNPNDKTFITIPNGFEPEEFEGAAPFLRPTPDRITIVYTGVWKDGYGPSLLYDAISCIARTDPSSISNLSVMTAGFAPGQAVRYGISEYVREFGRMTHTKALSLMKSADVLFLPVFNGKQERFHLPGKLFEYAAAGKPILAAVPPDGESAAFLARVGGGYVIPPRDPAALQQAIQQLARLGSLPVIPQDRTQLDCYRRSYLAERLAEVLKKAVENSQTRQTM
jgi:glycosyltransferase involved in cell wall biosynthesis